MQRIVIGRGRLKLGDRINDAIHAAGGFKANARQDVLNLADTVRDADQIFVPSTTSLTAPAAKRQNSPDYDGASYSSHHPFIVRGTPVRVALASATPQTTSAPTPIETENSGPSATPASSGTDTLPMAAASADEPPTAPAVPEPAAAPAQGRVLGKPAPVEANGEVAEGEDEPQEAVTSPAKSTRRSATRTISTRRPAGTSSKSSGASSAKFKNPGDGIVHLNRAIAAELEKLPGVGPAMSGRILDYRRQINGFKSIEQIMDVKGIGDKKFAKMRPFLAL